MEQRKTTKETRILFPKKKGKIVLGLELVTKRLQRWYISLIDRFSIYPDDSVQKPLEFPVGEYQGQ